MDDNTPELMIKVYPTIAWVTLVAMVGLIAINVAANPPNWPVVGALLPAILLIPLLASTVEIQSDRNTRTLTITQRYFYRTVQQRVAFDDIHAIRLRAVHDMEPGIVYRVELLLKNGDILPIEKVYAGNRKKQEALVQRLRDFIHTPDAVTGLLDERT